MAARGSFPAAEASRAEVRLGTGDTLGQGSKNFSLWPFSTSDCPPERSRTRRFILRSTVGSSLLVNFNNYINHS